VPLKDLSESAVALPAKNVVDRNVEAKKTLMRIDAMAEMPFKDLAESTTSTAKPVFLGFSAPPMKTPENPAFGFGTLLALHLPGDEEKLNLSPMNVAAYKEVSNYLADMRPYSWISFAPTLSSEGQTALTIALLRLTLKLTGAKLANFKLPCGKMHTEVVTYLALIQNIVDAMAGSQNWKAASKDYNLDKMHADITKIVTNF